MTPGIFFFWELRGALVGIQTAAMRLFPLESVLDHSGGLGAGTVALRFLKPICKLPLSWESGVEYHTAAICLVQTWLLGLGTGDVRQDWQGSSELGAHTDVGPVATSMLFHWCPISHFMSFSVSFFLKEVSRAVSSRLFTVFDKRVITTQTIAGSSAPYSL